MTQRRTLNTSENANYDFTYDSYFRIIDRLRGLGFCLDSFHENFIPHMSLLIRHDVDFDLRPALALAEKEREQGVVATYFVQFDSEFYSAICDSSIEIIREITSLGHHIGLHLNPPRISKETMLESIFDDIFSIFRANGISLSPVFSWHRPTTQGFPELLHSKTKSKYSGAYDTEFFKDIPYFSDSNMEFFWSSREFLDIIEQQTTPKGIQILTHPIWWDFKEHNAIDTYKRILNLKKLHLEGNLRNSIKIFGHLDYLYKTGDAKLENNH